MPEIEESKLKAMEDELTALRPLKDSSEKAQTDFKAKEDAWLKEKTDLESQVNPNWQKARKQIEVLQTLAKEKGITLDAEGNPVGESKNVNIDDIKREAAKTVTEGFLTNRLDELLEDFTPENAAVIKVKYNKLVAGEEVSMQNIRKFVEEAINAAGIAKPDRINRALNGGGSGPRQVESGGVLSDEAAKTMADLMKIKIK